MKTAGRPSEFRRSTRRFACVVLPQRSTPSKRINAPRAMGCRRGANVSGAQEFVGPAIPPELGNSKFQLTSSYHAAVTVTLVRRPVHRDVFQRHAGGDNGDAISPSHFSIGPTLLITNADPRAVGVRGGARTASRVLIPASGPRRLHRLRPPSRIDNIRRGAHKPSAAHGCCDVREAF